MSLQIDYRPQNFKEVIGNEGVVESIESKLKTDFPHAVLLQGPKGCGKTTLARLIAKTLMGVDAVDKGNSDFTQMDGGDVKADTVVSIKQISRYKPQRAKCRVYLIDEAHMIGAGGDSNKNIPQNNMLTIVEEAPSHVYFIFTTTDPERLLGTLRSRCTTYEVKALRDGQIKDLINWVLKEEQYEGFPEDIIRQIADVVEGCPRQALVILDQIIDLPIEKMSSAIQDLRVGDKNTADLCKALLSGQSWKRTSSILKQMDLNNPETIRRAVIGWMSGEVMKDDNPRAALIYDCFKEPFYNTGKSGLVMACYQAGVLGAPIENENAPEPIRRKKKDDDIPF